MLSLNSGEIIHYRARRLKQSNSAKWAGHILTLEALASFPHNDIIHLLELSFKHEVFIQ